MNANQANKNAAASANQQAGAPATGDGQPSVDELRKELAAAQDRALRAHADLENYRKRMRREMDEERRYASLPLLRDVLPVLDNLDRAIKAAESSPDSAGLLDGVKMVQQQLENVLRQHHCQRITAEGVAFDPSLHEAVSGQPSDQHPPHTVLSVVRAGFQLQDRVIRPAQVIVSTVL